ncbi:T-cell-specific guanine nucleotide triphosphate-binding protein 2-like [Hypomesus transpacificus]|uniref:T-cell-specific guanine nucleotide triphosphate-binding protein 2-like n=1 Tax=Hypomesus transpacificus TaxID=137520 RepID=UPI001F07460A|nr:T-cell-specific guanine nucleotide triphosphate-binding protein 2-like [Hypomesus transpacificus]
MAAVNEEPRVMKEELRNYLRAKVEEIADKTRKEQNSTEDVTINIAVTGESGVGKSTFVNALLGIADEEPGSAETGVTEIIKRPRRYPHPSMSNVFIWDLPGTATPKFRVKNYLRDVNFDIYDFFIFIGAVRFKENDLKLAKEIKKRMKMFYFVRSKIDHDISAESRKKNFNEEDVLNKIRLCCQDNLSCIGNVDVYLISSFELEKYDFRKLIDSLMENLSEHKRTALIQSMPLCPIL